MNNTSINYGLIKKTVLSDNWETVEEQVNFYNTVERMAKYASLVVHNYNMKSALANHYVATQFYSTNPAKIVEEADYLSIYAQTFYKMFRYVSSVCKWHTQQMLVNCYVPNELDKIVELAESFLHAAADASASKRISEEDLPTEVFFSALPKNTVA